MRQEDQERCELFHTSTYTDLDAKLLIPFLSGSHDWLLSYFAAVLSTNCGRPSIMSTVYGQPSCMT